MTAWVLTMIHRKDDGPTMPFPLEEVASWLGHGFQDQPEQPSAPAPTADELLQRAQMLNEVYGGTTHPNGTQPSCEKE